LACRSSPIAPRVPPVGGRCRPHGQGTTAPRRGGSKADPGATGVGGEQVEPGAPSVPPFGAQAIHRESAGTGEGAASNRRGRRLGVQVEPGGPRALPPLAHTPPTAYHATHLRRCSRPTCGAGCSGCRWSRRVRAFHRWCRRPFHGDPTHANRRRCSNEPADRCVGVQVAAEGPGVSPRAQALWVEVGARTEGAVQQDSRGCAGTGPCPRCLRWLLKGLLSRPQPPASGAVRQMPVVLSQHTHAVSASRRSARLRPGRGRRT